MLRVCRILAALVACTALFYAGIAARAIDSPRGLPLEDESITPDIVGLWQGPEWGVIVIRQTKRGVYEGKFTEVATPGPGSFTARWSAERRRFEGEWREGADQRGRVTFAPSPDDRKKIVGEWTIEEPKGAVDPPFGELRWERPSVVNVYGFHIGDEILDIFADQRIPKLLLNAQNITDQGLSRLKGVTTCSSLVIRATKTIGPGLLALNDVPGLTGLGLPRGLSEDALEYIVDLRKLQSLQLTQVHLTVDGCDRIAKLTQLTSLELNDCFLTERELARLAPLVNLESLNIANAAIDDAAMVHLKAFPHLKRLDISSRVGNDRLTNAALSHITEHKNVESLNLAGTAVDDEGIKTLSKLPHLKFVSVLRTRTTDAAGRILAALPEIETLSLSEDQTRAALKELQQAPHLKSVHVLPKGPDAPPVDLQDALPKCKVRFARSGF